MAKRSDKALSAVERLLKKNPKADTAALRATAERADASVKKLSAVSFNAQYALPTRRRLGLTKPPKLRKKKATRGTRVARPAVRRKRRLQGRALAHQLVQQRDEQVKALVESKDPDAAYALGASIDEHVDEIVEALRS